MAESSERVGSTVQEGSAASNTIGEPRRLGDLIKDLTIEIDTQEENIENDPSVQIAVKEQSELQAGLKHAHELLKKRFSGQLNGALNDDKKLEVIRDFIVREFQFKSPAEIDAFIPRMLLMAEKHAKRDLTLLDRCLQLIFEESWMRQQKKRRRR